MLPQLGLHWRLATLPPLYAQSVYQRGAVGAVASIHLATASRMTTPPTEKVVQGPSFCASQCVWHETTKPPLVGLWAVSVFCREERRGPVLRRRRRCRPLPCTRVSAHLEVVNEAGAPLREARGLGC